MLASELVLSTVLMVLFLIVGLLIGWVAREYMINYQDTPKFHPEFYDENGNIIADEIVAIRVEHDYDNDEPEEDWNTRN